MRLDHRQRTGLFRHLPVFFLALGGLGFGWGAVATASDVRVSPVAATDGSESPDVLLQLYMEFMLREMHVPVPPQKTTTAMAHAIVRGYEEQGTPKLKLLVELQFINTMLLTQAHLAAHPDLLDADLTSRLNNALNGMLADLVGEGRVTP